MTDRQSRIKKILALREKEISDSNIPKEKSLSPRKSRLRTEALPDIVNVEKDIQSRPSPFENIMNSINKPISNIDLIIPPKRPVELGLEILGEVGSRVEASIVNPLLAGLSGGTPLDVLKETGQGILGQRRGKFQDLFEAGSFKENFPVKVLGKNITGSLTKLASFVGEIATLNLATSGRMIKLSKQIKGIYDSSKIARVKKKEEFFINASKQFKNSIDELFKNIKFEFNNFFKKVGNNTIKSDQSVTVGDMIRELPKSVVDDYNKIIGKRKGIFLDAENPPQDINGVKAVRDIINRLIPEKAWVGNATEKDIIRMGQFKETGRIIANNTGSLTTRKQYLKLNEEFHKLSDFHKKISSITEKSKGIEKGLQSIKSKAQSGELKILRDFGDKYFPEAENILKSIDRFNRNEKIASGVSRIVGIGAGFAVANSLLFRPIRRELDDLLDSDSAGFNDNTGF